MPIPAGPDPGVTPAPHLPWTNMADVLTLTGEVVTQAHVSMASAMIDTKTGVSGDLPEDALSARDRRTLAKATAWQAAWISSKPGLLTHRESTRQTTSAGVSDRRDSDSAILYAPMALLEIKNLSWVGTRSEPMLPIGDRLGTINFLNERSDECGTWAPL